MAETGLRPTEAIELLEQPQTIQCTTCKEYKPRSEFYSRSKNKNGLYGYCKSCHDGYVHKWRQKNPFRYIATITRASAKKRGLEYNLTPEYLETLYCETCPILGIPLNWGQVGAVGKRTDNTPSLDRIDNTKDYVPGNVVFISWKANNLKSNGTLEEFQKIVKFMEDHFNACSKDTPQSDHVLRAVPGVQRYRQDLHHRRP